MSIFNQILNAASSFLRSAPVQAQLPRLGTFVFFFLLSLLVGRYTPGIARLFTSRFSPKTASAISEKVIDPVQGPLRFAGTAILISLSLNFLREYEAFHSFLRPFADLAIIGSVAWLASGVFRQLIRTYGIDLVRRTGREVNELLLVFESLANVLIGFIAVLAFAQSQRFNLIGLLASFGLGSLAIVFAAQQILEQMLSTIVLYLDRPFDLGDYIWLADGQLGRVESIGLRSTKIRVSGKSTLFVIPNSILINSEIENVTRAKKVMVLLYLDFAKPLQEQDSALVQQVVKESTDSLFGIDPGSTSVSLIRSSKGFAIRARVTFFILGSSENSIELRKRLLELANDTISRKLASFGIEFTMRDPTAYVESPVTI